MTSIHDKSNAIIAAATELHVIGNANGIPVVDLQIMPPKGNRTRFEAFLRDADRNIVAQFEEDDFPKLRTMLAAKYKVGLKYSDLILEQTLDFYARLDASLRTNKDSVLVNQFETEYVTYSVIHHPAQVCEHFDRSKTRIEPEFYRAVAQQKGLSETDPDSGLIFDDCADTMFDAVVIIRNHIERALMQAFIPGALIVTEHYLKATGAK